MNGYRNQNACANCARVIRRFSDGPDDLFCGRILLDSKPIHQVSEIGICDDYEKHVPKPKPEPTDNNDIPF